MLGLPFWKEKLRAFVDKNFDKKAKKVLKTLTNELESTKAQATIERLRKEKAMEALRHEQKKRKRGKKLMEQFRAQEGSGALLFSPGKVRAAFELQEQRDQEREQEALNKESRIQERASLKAQKEQEARRKRDDRAIAKAARQAAEALKKAQREAQKEAPKAQKQDEQEAKAVNRRPRGRPGKRGIPPKPITVQEPIKAPEAPIQPMSRSGRVIRQPAHLRE